MTAAEQRYAKTQKGVEEVERRAHKLPPRLRAALILVFSSKTRGELVAQGEAIGAPSGFLDALAKDGFIEPVAEAKAAAAADLPASPTDRFIMARRFVEITVAEAGGLKAFFIQMALQKAGNADELREFLPRYREFIAKHADEATADLYESEVARLLG